MKVLAYAASNSSRSINRKLVNHAAQRLGAFVPHIEVETLDINDYEMPIYSTDREANDGVPQLAHVFKQKIDEADGLIVSYAEHNGHYPAAYKNIYDWVSRIDRQVYGDKPMLMLSTSPGSRGGAGALAAATTSVQRLDAELVGHLSVPRFHENFVDAEGVKDPDLTAALDTLLQKFGGVLEARNG